MTLGVVVNVMQPQPHLSSYSIRLSAVHIKKNRDLYIRLTCSVVIPSLFSDGYRLLTLQKPSYIQVGHVYGMIHSLCQTLYRLLAKMGHKFYSLTSNV